MVKRISQIVLAALFGVAAMTVYYLDFAEAGTYTLEYPQGYGCNCAPNAGNFGYFHAGWREWPGEIRLDKTFPRSVGMEAIPAPEGQEIIPTPPTPKPLFPGELPPTPGPEGAPTPLEEGLPSEEPPAEKPAEPAKEIPPLPGLPAEPGGFNPLPGLPSEFSEPQPLNSTEKKDDTPAPESKEESKPDSESQEKNKTDSLSPDIKPDDGTKIKSPQNSSKLSQLPPSERAVRTGNPKIDLISRSPRISERDTVEVDPLFPAKKNILVALHLAPIDSETSVKPSRDIATQLCQEPSNLSETSAVVQSEFKLDVPPVALAGFCPVALLRNESWVPGDPRWTVVYKGYIYRLSGNDQRHEFLANPENFIPVNNGFDVVHRTIEKQTVSGQVKFCAVYKERIYMFSNAANLEEFYKHPELYAEEALK